MAWMHFNMSVAVAVGFIALAGVAAETGVVMLIYLDHALTERRSRCASESQAFTREDLRAAIMAGAVERERPKMMTVTAIIAGLLPILWSHGTGSELMQRIAVSVSGGRNGRPRWRTDDRRHDLLDRADSDRDPGDLRHGQGLAHVASA
jgi:copper/silver efflux system protein